MTLQKRSMVAVGIFFAALAVATQAATLERDVEALRLLRWEVEVRGREWSRAVSNWKGGGQNSADDPCGFGWKGIWYGVECRDQEHLPKEVPRVVTNLHLTDLGLNGPIPLAVTLLKNLTELDLDGNKLEGPMNPYMGCMESLKELDLANNTLWGTIPAEWRFIPGLFENEIESNKGLHGCIPKGLPPTKTVCRIKDKVPICELVGTISFDTGLTGFCDDYPDIEKKCATPELVREFIKKGRPYGEYFKSQATQPDRKLQG